MCCALWLLPAMATSDLVLPDVSGKLHPVSEYIGKGKWTVVAVWSADCPICRRDMYHMSFLHAAHRDKDATVLGLSVDGLARREKAAAFVEDQMLDFPNLIGDRDTPRRLSGRSFLGTPTFYIFSPEGKFVTERIGAQTQEQLEALLVR